MAKYAKDQPAGFTNRIERVAIVGAGGSIGKYMTTSLLATGKHSVLALTRKGSPNISSLPKSPHLSVAEIDYSDENTIINALKSHGTQFLIITLAVFTPPDTHLKLVRCAAAAGVQYVMPNGYGGDPKNTSLLQDTFLMSVRERAQEVEAAGLKWVGLCCSFWYEFSLLGGQERYGFDFKNKRLVLFDDGETKINTTTWDMCGRAVAGLLSLPILAQDEEDAKVVLSRWDNKAVYVASFLASQKDMFHSWLRVSGEKEDEWVVTKQNSEERYKEGVARMMAGTGDHSGFAQAMYTRVFYPNGDGSFELKYGLDNERLGLPAKEDLDDATARAKKWWDEGVYFGTKTDYK
ncbi:hypothetical protein QBC46DRAFT_286252 [Diplogelasinospora grovesii]|uniref:NmrA-like domain-containing protein n=1 Tax=Diplogelasinospora grovesii TaxID=303347 RepID=A0AAN6N938_9PEZI|nr:hypothetical protein QBC46DRAFT_286252 [Diplogelasinospora grovesii]